MLYFTKYRYLSISKWPFEDFDKKNNQKKYNNSKNIILLFLICFNN